MDPLPTGAGPDPLDMPTEDQGRALAALDSGRWAIEPGTSALSALGEGPGPSDALGLVRELRVRDWIDVNGEVTLDRPRPRCAAGSTPTRWPPDPAAAGVTAAGIAPSAIRLGLVLVVARARRRSCHAACPRPCPGASSLLPCGLSSAWPGASSDLPRGLSSAWPGASSLLLLRLVAALGLVVAPVLRLPAPGLRAQLRAEHDLATGVDDTPST